MVKVSIYIVVYSSTVRPLVSQPLAGAGDQGNDITHDHRWGYDSPGITLISRRLMHFMAFSSIMHASSLWRNIVMTTRNSATISLSH